MQVFCITGPCGAGKSSVMLEVPSIVNGLYVQKHKEGYREQDLSDRHKTRHYINNLTQVSKLRYQGEWFNSCIDYKASGENIVLSDRSPMDTVSYVPNKPRFFEVVSDYFHEVKSEFGIDFIFIYLCVSEETMLERIRTRLLRETWRRNYNEDKPSVMTDTRNFFEAYRDKWDFVIDAEQKVEVVASEIKTIIASRS